jgi:hypothetical protein
MEAAFAAIALLSDNGSTSLDCYREDSFTRGIADRDSHDRKHCWRANAFLQRALPSGVPNPVVQDLSPCRFDLRVVQMLRQPGAHLVDAWIVPIGITHGRPRGPCIALGGVAFKARDTSPSVIASDEVP